MSKREERIQNLAAGLLIAGRSPADALAQSALFVQLCEARDASEAEVEATHDPGEDHEFEAYVAAVQDLAPTAPRWAILNYHRHGFAAETAADSWLAFVAFTEQQRKGVNP